MASHWKAAYICPKCGRDYAAAGGSWQGHHIVARSDGGADDPDNIIYLCVACHTEWHAVERALDLSFHEWLTVPPAAWLIAVWISGPGDETLDVLRKATQIALGARRQMSEAQ